MLFRSKAEWLSKDQYDTAIQQGESQIAINASKLNFHKKEEPALPKLEGPAHFASAPQLEETPPTKRAEKPKAEAPKPKVGLASMVDEWDDK